MSGRHAVYAGLGSLIVGASVYAATRCRRDHVGSSMRITIIGALELLATLRPYADDLPAECQQALGDFGAIVAEHVEIR